ncbi:hypothetical protein RJ640_002278 [Escallonia rubra]|uniref:protein-serine/threonine phosphatase n=1 Tax=Escallonia rubra TaxID=112253 RepID=A0AA88SN66_9ASTE|nr:hypothetical protein RJ640_002278 [Escallonia rubra]
MPVAVAVANSPVFSPSRSHMVSPRFFKATSSSSSPSASSSTSPLSPLALRLHKATGCNKDSNKEIPVCLTSPTVLKRKRPAMIAIPVALTFAPAVETPAAGDRLDEVVVEGEGYSVYCKRGKRGFMEDRYSAVVDLEGDSKQAFFGVFDGHGGAKAAEFASKNMDRNILDEVAKRCDDGIEDAVKEGYLTTDMQFLNEDVSGGTCSVTALIRKGNIVVSNAGDCRAVMSRGGVAEALTVDHRPSRKDERERVEGLGAYVDCCHGVWRIQGCLAVSRGIGDRHLKQWVIAEPETRTLSISPDCEFLILASDGLWDKVSNQEAVDVVRPLCEGVDNPEQLSACKKLADLSVTRGSADDVSVMVIQLRQFLP